MLQYISNLFIKWKYNKDLKMGKRVYKYYMLTFL